MKISLQGWYVDVPQFETFTWTRHALRVLVQTQDYSCVAFTTLSDLILRAVKCTRAYLKKQDHGLLRRRSP